jgi:hypothetical protein
MAAFCFIGYESFIHEVLTRNGFPPSLQVILFHPLGQIAHLTGNLESDPGITHRRCIDLRVNLAPDRRHNHLRFQIESKQSQKETNYPTNFGPRTEPASNLECKVSLPRIVVAGACSSASPRPWSQKLCREWNDSEPSSSLPSPIAVAADSFQIKGTLVDQSGHENNHISHFGVETSAKIRVSVMNPLSISSAVQEPTGMIPSTGRRLERPGAPALATDKPDQAPRASACP